MFTNIYEYNLILYINSYLNLTYFYLDVSISIRNLCQNMDKCIYKCFTNLGNMFNDIRAKSYEFLSYDYHTVTNYGELFQQLRIYVTVKTAFSTE